MKRFFLFAAVSFASLAVISSQGKFRTGNKVEITRMDYIIENIDPSYFTDFSTASLFINFYFHYDDSRYKIKKLKEIEVENQTGTAWGIDLTSYLDQEQRYFGGLGRWYDSALSTNGSLLPIGKIICRLQYPDDQITEDSFIVALPGKKEGPEDAFIYSEDYNGVKRDNYFPCLKRALVKTALYSDDHLTIEFTIDDEKAFNGKVWFFDRNREYAGRIERFVHPYSLESVACLNKGEGFYSDGRLNRIEITRDKLDLKEKYSFEDVHYLHVVIEDGRQFQDDTKKDDFHYRSVSKMYTLEYAGGGST